MNKMVPSKKLPKKIEDFDVSKPEDFEAFMDRWDEVEDEVLDAAQKAAEAQLPAPRTKRGNRPK